MAKTVSRRTVDLSDFPDLVVIYLGIRVNALAGLRTAFGFRPDIVKSVNAQPEGLLLHEDLIYGFFPPHIGMRQYWRDFEALERWARSEPHRLWWQKFMRDSGGTGFWHEAYFIRGGMEAIYVDMVRDTGFLKFAPQSPARGAMFSARGRVRTPGRSAVAAPISEDQFYAGK
jgi:hypothetical protein